MSAAISIEQVEEVAREFHDYYFNHLQTHACMLSRMPVWDELDDDDFHKRAVMATVFYLIEMRIILPEEET